MIKDHHYGMSKAELSLLKSDEIGITVFHPGNIGILKEFMGHTVLECVTVGLDTISDYAEMLKRVNGSALRDEGEAAFLSQRKTVEKADVVLSGDAEVIETATLSLFRCLRCRGVLDRSAITGFIGAGALLRRALLDNVQCASYDLRVGDRCWCKGKMVSLQPKMTYAIPPYSYIIVKAEEEARLPNFIVASYDLRVSLFIQGVMLSNGPQVDPGFCGGLLCMLFNGSDANVGIRRGEHFATIEFSVTTKVTEGYSDQYQNKADLVEYMQPTIEVSSGGTITEQLAELRGAWDVFRNSFIVAGIALILGLAVAGFTVFHTASEANDKADKARLEAAESIKELQTLVREERAWRKEVEDSIGGKQNSQKPLIISVPQAP